MCKYPDLANSVKKQKHMCTCYMEESLGTESCG